MRNRLLLFSAYAASIVLQLSCCLNGCHKIPSDSIFARTADGISIECQASITEDIDWFAPDHPMVKMLSIGIKVTNRNINRPIPSLTIYNVVKYAKLFINGQEQTTPAWLGGLQIANKKPYLGYGEADSYGWTEYLNEEAAKRYGDFITIQWKYCSIKSKIVSVDIKHCFVDIYEDKI